MSKKRAGVEQAVQRALSEALGGVERQLGEVQDSFARVKEELKAAGKDTSADRFVQLLPPLMHMQAAGAALAASIETVLRFVGVSAQWKETSAYAKAPAAKPVEVPLPEEAPAHAAEVAGEAAAAAPVAAETPPPAAPGQAAAVEEAAVPVESIEPPALEEARAAGLDISSLPDELKQLHRKAKRFAKVTVQELMMYNKEEVTQGRQNRDLYQRFKDEIDKSKILYDKRFAKIADHNIDYLYAELVRVLAENDPSALGDYPYSQPTSGLR
ncbi:MAG: hypothetical protein ACE5HL_12115 [Terriglobia bacterium]